MRPTIYREEIITMEISTVSQLILQLGLPTVGCVAMALSIKVIYTNYREDIKTILSQQNELNAQLQEKYDTRIEKITETITEVTNEYNAKITEISLVLQQNTTAIEKLMEELDKEK